MVGKAHVQSVLGEAPYLMTTGKRSTLLASEELEPVGRVTVRGTGHRTVTSPYNNTSIAIIIVIIVIIIIVQRGRQ